jgi:hypothetical protein
MLQTMLWAPFSLNTATPWNIIMRHYHMLSVSTLIMKNKCTPLCKTIASGDITFWGRRQSSTLITRHYSSCRPKENCRMTAIKSGPHTYNSSTSTSSIKREVPNELLISLVNLQSQNSPKCLTLASMRPLDGPTSMRQTLTSPPPTKCWEKTQWSLITILNMGCCAFWYISAFHQVSMQR